MSPFTHRLAERLALVLLSAAFFTAACAGGQTSPATPESEPATAPDAETPPETGDTAAPETAPPAATEVADLKSDLGPSLDADTIREACEHYVQVLEAQSCPFGDKRPSDFAGCVETIGKAWTAANSVDAYDMAIGAVNDCMPGAESCDDLEVCLDNL